ncbi:MAG: 2-oxo acid dehydrogenase subunit E2 [Salinibacterium sp.]|nr:2-oxo acid dehydrogenase subunit E2 [Salinibacterium sp.]
MKDFALPDLGEGLTESEIVEWHVAVGDQVTLNQPLADVETAKAIVQLPSPFEGVIGALYAEPGQTVRVGAPIVGFESADVSTAAPIVERNAVLVGYGPAVESGDRPKRKARSAPSTASAPSPVFTPPRGAALSTPPVRKLAHDLGVDLERLAGSGEGGAVTREDVMSAASVQPVRQTGGERRTPIKGVRKATAAAMVASAFTAPHVTEFLTVDVTRSSELVGRVKAGGERASMLGVVAKALCLAVARNPSVNSRWDESSQDIVEFDSVNLGIAVATPRGLMVPNIPDAQALALGELTAAIAALAETARAGQTTPAALSGGTISITNVGVFGIDAGTPILNPGEAAILAMGAVRRLPWEFEGEIALRDVMTLSLSFDHRLVDGEQGARFLTDIGRVLVDPATVLTLV